MTNDELRAAAEAVVREAFPDTPGSRADVGTANVWYDQQAVAVAQAYLSEHPADDAEKVDADWLAAALPGFVVTHRGDMGGCEFDGWLVMAHVKAGVWVVSASHRTSGNGARPCPTRGHVRRLLRALRIDPPA